MRDIRIPDVPHRQDTINPIAVSSTAKDMFYSVRYIPEETGFFTLTNGTVHGQNEFITILMAILTMAYDATSLHDLLKHNIYVRPDRLSDT